MSDGADGSALSDDCRILLSAGTVACARVAAVSTDGAIPMGMPAQRTMHDSQQRAITATRQRRRVAVNAGRRPHRIAAQGAGDSGADPAREPTPSGQRQRECSAWQYSARMGGKALDPQRQTQRSAGAAVCGSLTRVTGIRLLHHVSRQHADGVDAESI